MGMTTASARHAKAGRHPDGEGLYLLVSDTGAKSWVLRVQTRGKRRDIGLGSFIPERAVPVTDVPLIELKVLTLAEAREKARALRSIAKSGGDPIAVRDRKRVTIPTFREAAKKCQEEGPPCRWKMKHSDLFLSTLKEYAFPKMGDLLVDSIDETHVVAALAKVWHDKPATARKVRQWIKTVLDFSKARGWRTTGAPQVSPQADLGKQPRSGNFAMMPYGEVPSFVATLRGKEISAARLALLFTILTAARSGEVRNARWSQIDFDARTWTRPAEMMKAGEAHVVTLSPAALAVLEAAKPLRALSSDVIFPGTKGQPLTDMALLLIVKREQKQFTVHGFRASFRTWCAEKMPTIPEAVAEAALAHTVPDAVVRAYQRAKFMDLRRQLLDAWAAYLDGHSNVVRLASAS